MPARDPSQHPPERRSTSGALLPVVLAMSLTAAGTLWSVFQVPAPERQLVAVTAGGLSVVLCLAVAVAVNRAGRLRQANARLRAVEDGLAALSGELLADAAGRLRGGATADTVLRDLGVHGATRDVLAAVVRELGTSERQRAAAMAACANAAGRMQAMATSMLADLREMEGRHAESVLGDLLRLDHSTAQTGRLADSIAVLTGARSGRRWTKPIVMESILRGAMGRIQAYQRVQLHSTSTAAIVGYAAEDVMHALAELMDNATRFSAPTEEVHVYVEELATGVVLTVEDGGLGMKPQALARAEAAVSTDAPLDLAKVPGTRLGLVVVGSLARKHKLRVYFRPSSRGGTGVVLRIPSQLVIHPREENSTTAPLTPVEAAAPVRTVPAAEAAPTPAATATAVLDPAPAADPPTEPAVPPAAPAPSSGLPKRPPGQTFARSAWATGVAPRATRAPGEKTDLGARFSAFQQGRRTSKPDDTGQPPAGKDESR